MIKPEKTINGTKWIETIQINAEERATLEDQYGIDEDIIEYVTDNEESTNSDIHPCLAIAGFCTERNNKRACFQCKNK